MGIRVSWPVWILLIFSTSLLAATTVCSFDMDYPRILPFGDWEEEFENGSAPLLPTISTTSRPLQLFSLEIDWLYATTAGSAEITQTQNATAKLCLYFSTNKSESMAIYIIQYLCNASDFEVRPDFVHLGIMLEGVYSQSKNGDKMLNMVSSSKSTASPFSTNVSDFWLFPKRPSPPAIVQDAKISLQMHFPGNFSLGSASGNKISGRLSSRQPFSHPMYFDPIDLSAQVNFYSHYKYSEGLVKQTCNPYPYPDMNRRRDLKLYKGEDFQRIFYDRWFDVVPNWQCHGTDSHCKKFGPFVGDEVDKFDGRYDRIKILVQDSQMEEFKARAVFRTLVPNESPTLADKRRVLDGQTLLVEGQWNLSSDQLCMVGCRFSQNRKRKPICDTRICMYMPLNFSLTQRSYVVGSIASIYSGSELFHPLSFEMMPERNDQNPHEPSSFLNIQQASYQYTKMKLAKSLMEKGQSSPLKMFSKYPKYEWVKGSKANPADFCKTLSVDSARLLRPSSQRNQGHSTMRLRILAMDKFLTPYCYGHVGEFNNTIAAQIEFPGDYFLVLTIFAEGVYDPTVGKLYLIGCKDVRDRSNVFNISSSVEKGFDCQIEVEVKYPSFNIFLKPTVEVSIRSNRSRGDPLFFETMNFHSLQIIYEKLTQDINFRIRFEGILSILTLSAMIYCIKAQLAHSMPYISLAMLGVQAVAYCILFVNGEHIVFPSMRSDSKNTGYSAVEKSLWCSTMNFIIRFLLLFLLVLTLRLYQKVWKSRSQLLSRRPLEPSRVPSEKKVAIFCATLYSIGFQVTLFLTCKTVRFETSPHIRWNQNIPKPLVIWQQGFIEYFRVILDFFLLPQFVGNLVWKIDGRSLRKVYYIGVTLLRLLPHIYDCFRPPILPSSFTMDNYEYENPDASYHSKLGNTAIIIIAAMLAVLIYIQQRWNNLKLGEALKMGSTKRRESEAELYDRLATELTNGVAGLECHADAAVIS